MFPELPIQTLGQLACVRAMLIESLCVKWGLCRHNLRTTMHGEKQRQREGGSVSGWVFLDILRETCVSDWLQSPSGCEMPRYRFLGAQSRTFYLPNMSIGQYLFHVCRYWAAGCSVSVTSAATHRVHYLPAVDLSTAGIEPTSRRADFSPPWTLHETKQDERNV